jgi:hypothetical protein
MITTFKVLRELFKKLHLPTTIVFVVGICLYALIISLQPSPTKSHLFKTSDKGSLVSSLLVVETDSKFSVSELDNLFGNLSMSSLIELRRDSASALRYFDCNVLEISEYSIPHHDSFKSGSYDGKLTSFSTYDVAQTTAEYIKTIDHGSKYIEFMKEKTSNQICEQRASALFNLEEVFNVSN